MSGNARGIIEVVLPVSGVNTPTASIGNRNTTSTDNSVQVATVNITVSINDLQHFCSRVILDLTKVVMKLLSFGEPALQSASSCFRRYEARCSIDNDVFESWLIATMHVSLVRIFNGTLKSSKILEHWGLKMMQVFTRARRQPSKIQGVGTK